MRYCKDCKYYNDFMFCTLPLKATIRNVVDGKPFTVAQPAEMMRGHESYCGSAAEKFQPKEVEDASP